MPVVTEPIVTLASSWATPAVGRQIVQIHEPDANAQSGRFSLQEHRSGTVVSSLRGDVGMLLGLVANYVA
jgi:hypothetical protein